jgi:hypothetical protein
MLRLRPATMTKVAIIAALRPILLGKGVGSEAMQGIAAPMVRGTVSVALLTLAVIPCAYSVWRGRRLAQNSRAGNRGTACVEVSGPTGVKMALACPGRGRTPVAACRRATSFIGKSLLGRPCAPWRGRSGRAKPKAASTMKRTG